MDISEDYLDRSKINKQKKNQRKLRRKVSEERALARVLLAYSQTLNVKMSQWYRKPSQGDKKKNSQRRLVKKMKAMI